VTNFKDEIWISKGGNVNPIFQYVYNNCGHINFGLALPYFFGQNIGGQT